MPLRGSAYGRATPDLRPNPAAASILIVADIHPDCRRTHRRFEDQAGVSGCISNLVLRAKWRASALPRAGRDFHRTLRQRWRKASNHSKAPIGHSAAVGRAPSCVTVTDRFPRGLDGGGPPEGHSAGGFRPASIGCRCQHRPRPRRHQHPTPTGLSTSIYRHTCRCGLACQHQPSAQPALSARPAVQAANRAAAPSTCSLPEAVIPRWTPSQARRQ